MCDIHESWIFLKDRRSLWGGVGGNGWVEIMSNCSIKQIHKSECMSLHYLPIPYLYKCHIFTSQATCIGKFNFKDKQQFLLS